MKAYEFITETVDVFAIQTEALREHLLSNPALYENREDFQEMRGFLDLHRTPAPLVKKSYIYASVQATPVSRYVNIAHFNNEHILLKLDKQFAYFDVEGTVKRFPENGTLSGDSLSQIYFFKSKKELDQFDMLLKLKFSNYKQTSKILDQQAVTEGFYDSNPATYDLPRRMLNVPELIRRGAIFVVDPHGNNGWEPESEGFSLITLYNVEHGGWPAEAKQHLKPSMYKVAATGLNSQTPGQRTYDGKYNQILWSIKKLSIPDNVAFLDDKQAVTEGLDQSLSSMAGQDQAERNVYKAWVKAQPGAIMSAEMGAKYAQLKNRSKDDVFGDAVRQDKFMKMKFDFDKFTDKDWKDYWAMAQHCDKNRDFQKNALSIIKKYQGEDHIDRHYQYLYDRISCGTTGKQKYGTQDICGKDKPGVAEGLTETTSQLGPQLYTPHPKNLDESMKPEAALWTSTASSSNNGYTSAWVEWAKSEMPQWIGHSGFLYDVSPSARILTINSDQDAMRVAKKYGMNTTDIMDLFMYMPWKKIAKDYDAIHHVPSNRGADLFMHSWDVESTAWFNTKMLLNKRKVPILASKQGNLAPVKLR